MKIACVALLFLAACSPLRPQVSLEPGVSLKSYHVVVVGPVTDLTGYPFHYDIGDSLRARLIESDVPELAGSSSTQPTTKP